MQRTECQPDCEQHERSANEEEVFSGAPPLLYNLTLSCSLSLFTMHSCQNASCTLWLAHIHTHLANHHNIMILNHYELVRYNSHLTTKIWRNKNEVLKKAYNLHFIKTSKKDAMFSSLFSIILPPNEDGLTAFTQHYPSLSQTTWPCTVFSLCKSIPLHWSELPNAMHHCRFSKEWCNKCHCIT